MTMVWPTENMAFVPVVSTTTLLPFVTEATTSVPAGDWRGALLSPPVAPDTRILMTFPR